MKIRNQIIVALLCFINVGGFAQIISLDSCKRFALEKNYKIKNAQLNVEKAEQVKKSARTNYFPKISASAIALRSSKYLLEGEIPSMDLPVYDGNTANLESATQFAYVPDISISAMEYMNTASLSVAQPIFTGGQIINGNKLAKVGYNVSKQQQALTKTEALIKTEELYWNTVAVEEKLKTLLGYEKMLKQLLHDVKVATDAGLVQRSDLLKVQLKQNELEINKFKLQNGIELSKKALCQHIGIEFNDSLKLEAPNSNIVETLSLTPINAVNNRLELRMLDNALQAEELQKKMEVGKHLPQLSVGAIGYAVDMKDDQQSNAMVFASLSIPISDWWEGSHKIKEANLKIRLAENQKSETLELLQLQIKQVANQKSESFFEIKTAKISIDQAKENLNVATDNYNAGISSVSDLLEAQALYQESLDKYNNAICTYNIMSAKYLQAIGEY